jgi:hypothetical protein
VASSGVVAPEPEVTVVAVSVGLGAGWGWRIVARNGARLLESSGTFSGVGAVLEDGRRHVRAAGRRRITGRVTTHVGTALNGPA